MPESTDRVAAFGNDPPPAAKHEALRANGSDTGGNSMPGDPMRPAVKPRPDGKGRDPISVVGIGASAGGIQVLQELFGQLPADTGLAFVVVMHLSPDHESNLAHIIQARTKMPVIQVTAAVQVEKNHVYVIPPNKFLSMSDSMLVLSEPQQTSGRRVAIDLFFRTLAEQYGQRAVCIVLSGIDSDGAIGLKHVKAQGGVTIAQDPAEAEHDSMPRTAIETGMVDWILPVNQMSGRLVEYVENEQAITLPAEEDGEHAPGLPDLAPAGPGGPLKAKKTSDPQDENALHQVLVFLRSETGHDFAHYKRATVLRRIARRLQVNGRETLPSYLEFLQTHSGEARALLHDLLIGVTHFFRDQNAFASLDAHLPQLFAGRKSGDQLRVWTAGCATGEEAYSIAIQLCEHASRLEHPPSIQVFATDIDEDSVRSAREGLFPATIEADVSQERLRRYFYQVHGRYRIKKEIRELVLFAAHDLLRDSPFSRLDLVSCRNVLIYLKPEAQHRLLDIFHFALRPGGLLLLGGSENVDDGHSYFAPIDKRHRLYVRRTTPRAPLVNLLHSLRKDSSSPETVLPRHLTPRAVDGSAPEGSDLVLSQLTSTQQRLRSLGELHVTLIEQYAAPSLIVDENYEILHMSQRAGAFLRFAAGEPSANLLKLVDESLRLDLRTALFRAGQTGESVDVSRVRISREGEMRLVDLHVRPAKGPEDSPYYLVIFEEGPATSQEQTEPTQTEAHESVAHHLEEELRQLRAQLNLTVEQYEASAEELKASNEELQAMNEEMRSATEELETSKEELQSINEELRTVNHELKSNIEELGRTNSDLRNLMGSTDIATVFLDRELHIKRYTPRAQELFKVIPADLGRPLSDIRSKLDYPELTGDAEHVLRDLVKVEREVHRAEDGWFLARLSPYRTIEDKIDGVVLNFLDISERRRAEDAMRISEERLRLLIESAKDYAIFTTDPERRINSWSTGAEPIFGYSEREILGQSADILFTPEDREKADPKREMETARDEGRVANERWHLRKDGSRLYGSGSVMPLRDKTGKLHGFLKIMRDLTEFKQAEELLRSNMDELTRFNRVAVGRESRMIELKKEINELCQKLGEPSRYRTDFEAGQT